MPSKKSFDVVCIGFTCVDEAITGLDSQALFRQPLMPAKDVQFGVGGDAANEATVLARLGVNTQLITKLGGDFLGRMVLEHMQREGIDTQAITVDPAINTTIGVSIIGNGDDRYIIPVGENRSTAMLCESDIAENAFLGVKVVSFASLFTMPRIDVQAMTRIFHKVKSAGALLCMDVKMEGHERLAEIAPALADVDYIFPNFSEACLLTGEAEPEKVARRFLDCGVKTVVLKLGLPGCYVRSREEALWIPSYPADAVDSTGAGDNFAAGFITGLIKGLSTMECAKYACAAASICVRQVGSVSAIQNLPQLEQVIAQGEPDWANRASQVSLSWKAPDLTDLR